MLKLLVVSYNFYLYQKRWKALHGWDVGILTTFLRWVVFSNCFSFIIDTLWVLLQTTWRWFTWRGHLKPTKPSMLFQVGSKLFSPGTICEHFRLEPILYTHFLWESFFVRKLPRAILGFSCCSSKECREAVGGQGVKTENLVGQLKGEFDVQTTFEGDNNVLMQQVG